MTAFTLFLCLFCQVLVVAGNLLLKHAMAGIDGQERSRVQTGLWLFAGPRPPLRLVASDQMGEDVIRLTYAPA